MLTISDGGSTDSDETEETVIPEMSWPRPTVMNANAAHQMPHRAAEIRGCNVAIGFDTSQGWTNDGHVVFTFRPYLPLLAGARSGSILLARRAVQPFNVGDGTDFFAIVNGTTITSATGSFDSVTSVTDVFSQIFNGPPNTVFDNTYTLQVNANRFTTPLCKGVAGCLGWEQFIFSQKSECGSPCIYIEYWVYNFNAACSTLPAVPGATWQTFGGSSNSAAGCFVNTPGTSVDAQPVADLGKLKLTGTVSSAGDTVQLATANGDVFGGANNLLPDFGLAQAWSGTEFNIFGDCCGFEAFLNSGSSATVRLAVSNGPLPTQCATSFPFVTVETNNLDLLGTCSTVTSPAPAIVYTESGGGPISDGLSIGDTHLTMFAGGHYDMQASGEFVLVQADPGFIVQTRQQWASPPSVAVNTGVATQIGNNRVAVCLSGVVVNGWPTNIADGGTLSLSDGVKISRSNNAYVVSSPIGDTVRAEIAGSLINVTVGLGATNRGNVRGLLGTSNEDEGRGLTTRDGKVIRQPISRNDFISYVDGWRVNPADSLLCPDGKVKAGMPSNPIYASDLPLQEQERVRQICLRADVREGILLDDCMLDVSMLGSAMAADFFVHARVPKEDIRPVVAGASLIPPR
jgi:von Willebrand factor type D domain